MIDFTADPHRRYNPLNGEWVLVSPHRGKRPWLGQTEVSQQEARPRYDPTCYLCPGNQRVHGEVNDAYSSTYVFTNDFSPLLPDVPKDELSDGLFVAQTEQGIGRVICFSPDHSLTIPEMRLHDIVKVVDLWCEEYKSLGRHAFINHVQIFENKGSVMGCSNPHPHGQIWAQSSIPVEVAKEIEQQRNYLVIHKRPLLSEYLDQEIGKQERIVEENNTFVSLVPFWAVWPFETIILPRRQVASVADLTSDEKMGFADMYRKLTIKYDNLFETSFPYSAGIHQAPTDGREHPEWVMHMHFYPPLLRSASVKKFMVGYEMMANAQRDITAEQSSQRLRDLPTEHYTVP